MVDFHTHILPGIDDGSSSLPESIEMLQALKTQSVSGVVLTPHFYAYKCDIESFLDMRDSAVCTLKNGISFEDLDLNLYIGAEVLYFEDLWQVDNLDKLCILGTKYILIEMPFQSWPESFISGVERIMSRGLIPIMAHFDRYISYRGNSSAIEFLLNAGALLQMNCSYLNRFSSRRHAVSYVKKGKISVLGSDCHNMTVRAPCMKEAWDYLIKHGCQDKLNAIERREQRILYNAEQI